MRRNLTSLLTAVLLVGLAGCGSSQSPAASSSSSAATSAAATTEAATTSSSAAGPATASGSQSAGSGAAGSSTQAASYQTLVPGVLTIALPDFPYKGYIEGNDPTSPTDGYYVQMITKIANDMGLKPAFKKVDFTAFIAGQMKDYDVAVDTLSVTPERQQLFEMTVPVVQFYKALFTKEGVAASTKADIQDMVLGSGSTSVNFKFITEQIKPTKEPRGFAQDVSKYDAVLVGQIDGAIGDLYVSLAKTHDPKFKGTAVACKWTTPSTASWALPKGSPLIGEINKRIDAMRTDGTLEALTTKYIIPLAGGSDPNAVPGCPDF